MSGGRSRVVLYFVKYPEPGRVKTRLAKTLGAEVATIAYQRLAESIFQGVKDLGVKNVSTVVLFDPAEKELEIKQWLPGATSYQPQKGEGLGERLANAFHDAFQVGATQVLALASDTLGFKPEVISRAFDLLNFYEVVIGPVRDGGYYLIGLSASHTFLFRDIPWSTQDVLQTTLRWIREEGLPYTFLEELEDLDEIKIQ